MRKERDRGTEGQTSYLDKEEQLRKWKREEKERVKHPTPSQATDELIGDEEQNIEVKKKAVGKRKAVFRVEPE